MVSGQQQQQSSQARQAQAMTSIIREAMNLMDNSPSSSSSNNRLNQPVSEFLRSFGIDDSESEDSNDSASSTNQSLIGIISAFFASLSIGDMINLARSVNTEQAYENARPALQAYIKRHLRNENEVNDANLTDFVNRLYIDMFEDPENTGFYIDFDSFNLIDPQIDFKRSFSVLIKHHLNILARLIFDTNPEGLQPPTRTWGMIFRERFNTFLDQTINLFRICVHDADTRMNTIVLERMREAMNSQGLAVNTAGFFSIFESITRVQIQSIISSVPNLPRSTLEQFIVKRSTDVAHRTERKFIFIYFLR